MNQTQNYARQSRKLGLVHTNSQLKQVALKTKIKLTEYVRCNVCEAIRNEWIQLLPTECKNKAITKVKSEFLILNYSCRSK